MRLQPVLQAFGLVSVAALALLWMRQGSLNASQVNSGKLQVVAAENFYGDIAAQLGGDHVQVLSIMSDPNVDPHQYEADPSDALAVAKANLVIQNGADYDSWMPRLLGASPSDSRIVLTAADIAPDVRKDNPHLWYSAQDIRAVAGEIARSYEKLDVADKPEFEKNLKIFDESLAPIEKEMDSIRHEFASTPVGLTETVCLYQTDAMKLDVVTPWEFQQAIAQGEDPPVQSIAAANAQVTANQIKVLIYDVQTVTPITSHLEQEARDAGIPVVGVSETMPPGERYQSWMLRQLQSLHKSLQGALSSGTK